MSKPNNNLLDMEHRVGGPAFRWNLAKSFAKSQRSARFVQADEHIQQASAYLRMFQEISRELADSKYPTIAAACRLTENKASFRTLRLSILGSLPRSEVAARLGVDQHITDAAEALFFDISGLSQASGWMNCHVFIPESRFGSKELAAKIKLAYYGGPVVTRALLDGQDKLPMEEAQQIIDQELQLHAKLQAALEFDLDANAAQQFLEVFLNYDLERKKLEFEREKFQLACAQARKQRTNDRAAPAGDSANETASRPAEPHDEEQVGRSVVRPADDEQLVA